MRKLVMTSVMVVAAVFSASIASAWMATGQKPAARTRGRSARTTRRALNAQEIARKALGSLVYVDARSVSGGGMSGTGFFIGNGHYIVTAKHVVAGRDTIEVRSVYGGPSRPASVYWAEAEDIDMAILWAGDRSGLKGLPVSFKRPEVGEAVYVASNPRGFGGTFVAGNVSGYRADFQGGLLMQISAPVSHGSSGGAVLNGKGEVVGIVASSRVDGQNLNFAVPCANEDVREAIAQVFIDERLGIHFRISPERFFGTEQPKEPDDLPDFSVRKEPHRRSPQTEEEIRGSVPPSTLGGWSAIATLQGYRYWYAESQVVHLHDNIWLAPIKKDLVDRRSETVRHAGLPAAGKQDYSHSMDLYECDCRDGLGLRLSWTIDYDRRGRILASGPPNSSLWHALQDGSAEAKIWLAVCLVGKSR